MSVKTGAVGSNPKIDKLINVSANSLRGFAATSMVSDLLAGYVDISATNMAETNNLNHDEAYAVAEDSRKEVRENRDKMIISPKLPDEGIYVKDFDDGNIVQQYKKAADERQLQMQAAATLAFAEDYALRRNGIQEGERENFFSGYLSMESEYLVAGALLTCSQATNETIHIPDPDAVVETLYVYEGSEGKTENPLLNVANLANDGSARYATVSDTKRGINIIPFRNCRLTNIGKDGDIVLQNSKKCQKYGTCYALMDLCDEWVNVQPGAEYGTADDAKKNCINILSHLCCYQGGMIFPLDTGQGELEDEIESESVSKEDIISENRYLTEEEMQTNARYIYDYLSDAGWSHNAICGVFGNMQYESNFSPGTWLRHKENSAAFGISQWNPADKYFEWAEKAGLDPYDIDVQLSRILLEVEHDQIKHWQGWRHEANMSFEDYTHSNEPVEYLAEIYLRCYERPGDPDSEVLNRAKAARYWSDYFLK